MGGGSRSAVHGESPLTQPGVEGKVGRRCRHAGSTFGSLASQRGPTGTWRQGPRDTATHGGYADSRSGIGYFRCRTARELKCCSDKFGLIAAGSPLDSWPSGVTKSAAKSRERTSGNA
ncbi:unnamed protein product [Lampetra fluviatilis]